jgi:hypothetical protein
MYGTFHHVSEKHLGRMLTSSLSGSMRAMWPADAATAGTLRRRNGRPAADLQGSDRMSTSIPKPPEILDKIVDVVPAHRPKPTTQAAKKRKKTAKQQSWLHTSPTARRASTKLEADQERRQ